MTLAVVTALPEEMAPLARRLAGRAPAAVGQGLQCSLEGVDVWLMVTGDGAGRAREALQGLLSTFSIEAVIGLGVAGGLTADLALGDLVVAEQVIDEGSGKIYAAPASRWLDCGLRAATARRASAVSATAIAGDSVSKRRLSRLAVSTAVVDLESAAWCDAASAAGRAFVIARVVSDEHDESLPLDFERLRDDSGAVDRGRVLRAAAVRPRSWPGLLRLRRRLAHAGERLAGWSLEVLAA